MARKKKRDPASNAEIDELVRLASSALSPEAFAAGLDDDQADILLTLHFSVASRFGGRAASRACAALGGVHALQQLLRAMHKQKLKSVKQSKLMAEVDALLLASGDIDRIRKA